MFKKPRWEEALLLLLDDFTKTKTKEMVINLEKKYKNNNKIIEKITKDHHIWKWNMTALLTAVLTEYGINVYDFMLVLIKPNAFNFLILLMSHLKWNLNSKLNSAVSIVAQKEELKTI